jgi:hypothetical protein
MLPMSRVGCVSGAHKANELCKLLRNDPTGECEGQLGLGALSCYLLSMCGMHAGQQWVDTSQVDTETYRLGECLGRQP